MSNNNNNMLYSFKLQVSDAVGFVLQKYVDLKVRHEKEDLNGHQLVQSVSSRSVPVLMSASVLHSSCMQEVYVYVFQSFVAQ